MAAAIFDALAEDGGLTFKAQSAGVAALEGAVATPRAAETLAEIGVYIDPRHTARQVSEEVVRDAELVFAMTPRQADDLRRHFRVQAGKIYSLAEYVGDDPNMAVSDPYGHTSAAYRASARQLLGYLEPLVARLKAQERQSSDVPTVTGEADATTADGAGRGAPEG